ncbi:superoxide dismutase [Bacillus sp. AGMB 02131]|uniref:superoxide dismutase n=1 Tax=Peribacillus faecalis TaxID=2772559 RepID=A0A927HCM6_9BACI|nr:superoxide dismutase [Peribacillus faecalis]MBD3110199.1 superoxide dismutase [Peribacillus faecalis]
MDFKAYLREVKAWLEEIKFYKQSKRYNHEELDDVLKRMEFFLNGIKEDEVTENEIISLQTLVKDTNERLKEGVEIEGNMRQMYIPIGQHILPNLPYPYNALEPHISTEIMKLHHDKHHQSYVDGLNKAEKKMQTARATNDFSLLKHWEREASFHGGGHYLHTLFWESMSPKGGGEPKGALMRQINKDFESYNAFKQHFSGAAKQVEGSGWAILVWSPRPRRLEILQSENHNKLTQWDVIPLLPLDVWEHAYYLQYKNNRGAYVDNWWNVVNWPAVEARYEKAQKLQWKPV